MNRRVQTFFQIQLAPLQYGGNDIKDIDVSTGTDVTKLRACCIAPPNNDNDIDITGLLCDGHPCSPDNVKVRRCRLTPC